MFWTRVDNRLVHGQVIESWLPFTGATLLVVANDELAGDILQQEIMSLAIPHEVQPHFVRIDRLAQLLKKLARQNGRTDILLLFASCQDARLAYQSGVGFHSINIGNLHYGPGKKQLCNHVAISADDESCLDFFSEMGVEIDFRCIPSAPVQVKMPW